jgi:threonine dehydrogenase-like Zn-dependent dehydrogenase
VAIHAAYHRIPQAGEKIMVLGVGTIGFLLLQTLRHIQPHCHLTTLVQFPWQAELAQELGADITILAGEDGNARVQELTNARLYEGRGQNQMLIGGFDAVFDAVGIPATLNNALRWTRANGTVILVGVHLHRMAVDLTPVWHQEVDLIGAVGHDVIAWDGRQWCTFDLAMHWMLNKDILTEVLLTHTYSLHEYRAAFDTAVDKRNQKSIKVAFELSSL